MVLMVLLTVHLTITVLYDVVYVLRMGDGSSLREFVEMYSFSNHARAAQILWFVFAVQVGFSVAYYVVAGIAVYTKQPKYYRLFASFGIAGILGLVMLAYVDKFNLILFFLHLLTYIYAKFLQGLTASLLLLPPPANQREVV
jgi:hypothetical protein